MKKLNLNKVADEFDIISSETNLFYNKEICEFEFYNEYIDMEDDDFEKYDGDDWIAAPSQWDLDEYRIMEKFISTVSDSHKYELLSAAIVGRGAFRRFKDTLYRVDLLDEWYSYKHEAFVKIAREWCERYGIKYED